MATTDVQAVLDELLAPTPLSIISLSDEIRPQTLQSPKRNSGVSDVSADVLEKSTPGSIEADLAHYKELFSKLRFSYVEQLTKEKFLRAIISDPPPIVEAAENAAFEARLGEEKAALKAQKMEVEEIVGELERKGRELSLRYESIQLRTEELAALPAKITDLNTTHNTLSSMIPSPALNPSLSLPLPATQSLLSQRRAELEVLDAELAAFEAAVPAKSRELEMLEAELRPLEVQKEALTKVAREAMRRREQGEQGWGNGIEEQGRWWRAVEAGLRELMEHEV
ncbi:hypothetical protein M501DRAFT_1031206 [Patellaria atrata CBS 101060]|uniref:Kinetochore protein Sos7 coiled-coil domain-containing protein n=1 Tax=Patellaria atrata CBS 101060 TaxID=1346257 RepID=A0A9P4VRP1_9PEZI|nr:hypothetical protein M501DRAFT_1031206 [Patellaria atrata CBS 101060]